MKVSRYIPLILTCSATIVHATDEITDWNKPFGLQLGQTTIADLQKALPDVQITLANDPATQFFHGRSLPMHGWKHYIAYPDSTTVTALVLFTDKKTIIQRITIALTTSRQYDKIRKKLINQYPKDPIDTPFEESYHAGFVQNMDKHDPMWIAEVPINSLNVKGRGFFISAHAFQYGYLRDFPEQPDIETYGTIQYSEHIDNQTILQWKEGYPEIGQSVTLTTPVYQQAFTENLKKAPAFK